MLFPAVTELFGHLARLPALDDALEALRQGSPSEELAGLTTPAKALGPALGGSQLRPPPLIPVGEESPAEGFIAPLRFLYCPLNGNSPAPGLLIPARATL